MRLPPRLILGFVLCAWSLSVGPARAQVILQNQGAKPSKKVEEPEILDLRGLYPKSTQKEYDDFANKTKIGCVRFREQAIKIYPDDAGPGENPAKTCDCYYRNIAPAKDIHELRVIDAYFRRAPFPPSVLEDEPTVNDILDEREDYVAHANAVIALCKMNPAHELQTSTPTPTPGASKSKPTASPKPKSP